MMVLSGGTLVMRGPRLLVVGRPTLLLRGAKMLVLTKVLLVFRGDGLLQRCFTLLLREFAPNFVDNFCVLLCSGHDIWSP